MSLAFTAQVNGLGSGFEHCASQNVVSRITAVRRTTMLIAHMVPITVLRERLGHTSNSTTLLAPAGCVDSAYNDASGALASSVAAPVISVQVGGAIVAGRSGARTRDAPR
jgi:hypothetical protein